jgi:hypothetical protein
VPRQCVDADVDTGEELGGGVLGQEVRHGVESFDEGHVTGL